MKESFKSCIKQEESREMKKEMEKINKQIKDNLKSSQDKVSTLETQVKDTKSSQKDISDKLGKFQFSNHTARAILMSCHIIYYTGNAYPNRLNSSCTNYFNLEPPDA